MRLPPFLRFLAPSRRSMDSVRLSGHLRVDVAEEGKAPFTAYDGKNFVVSLGQTTIRDLILGTSSGIGLAGSVFRMAIGDAGCPPDDLFNPIQPDATWPARTGLYHEVIRQDMAAWSAPTSNSARFVAAFTSTDVDPTSFSETSRVINEAALIFGDGVLTTGGDKVQVNKTPPDTADADEKVISVRTFPSAPFDPTNNVTITLTWTLSVLS